MKQTWEQKQAENSQSISPKTSNPTILIIFCGLLIAFIYVWFVSSGHWFNWPQTGNYYDQLATSFDHGQLSLPAKADPSLLALSDPYIYNLRKNVPYLWDASLYNGKYYLYWGPAPALILAVIKPFYSNQIGDQYIGFIFLIGLLIFNILILTAVKRDFFAELPAWTIAIGLLLVGLVTPILWMLKRSAIYEAAISAEQFFLIGGIYWAYSAFANSSISKWRLFLAGIFWALAVGSRVVLAFPVAFLLCLAALGIARSHSYRKTEIKKMIWSTAIIGTPVILGIAAYGWYNWARFGSVSEFGFRYQLNKDNLLYNYNLIFSISYIRTNIHNYIIQPLRTSGTYPFFSAPVGADSLIDNTPGSAIYRARNIVGIIFNFPFVVFAMIPIMALFLPFARLKSIQHPADKAGLPIIALCIGLAGSAFFGMLPLLLYFRVAMRFLFDFTPPLALLSIVGFWLAYQFSFSKPFARLIVSIAALGLAIFSIIISMALTISFY